MDDIIDSDAEDSEESEEEVEVNSQKLKPRRQVMNVSMRFKSPTLLAVGAMSGITGFSFACIIGIIKFVTNETNPQSGLPYESGYGYWPATVSEQVHDWNSPEGRIFFGFCLIAALLIFQSWYPYELRNVYTGRSQIGGKFMYWITFRQIIPVTGLLLLISVSTVPMDQADGTSWFAVMVHLFGAFLMFVGYMAAELKCLGMLGFKAGKAWEDYLDIEPDEYQQRRNLMFLVLVAYGVFCFLQSVLLFSEDSWLCCKDKYVAVAGSVAIYEHGNKNRTYYNLKLSYLSDTASGRYLLVKIGSYLSEVIAGLCVIFGHLVIWYHCEERHVEFAANALAEVYDEENHVQKSFHAGSSHLRQ